MVAYISAAFPFSGQKPRPVKLPIFRFVIARIFYMIPYTEGKLKQLVSYLFGVIDSIFISAELKLPKIIVAVAVRHMISGFKVFFIRQLSYPLRRNKRNRLRSFAHLQKTGISHSLLIRRLRRRGLAVFPARLAAVAVLCTGKLR